MKRILTSVALLALFGCGPEGLSEVVQGNGTDRGEAPVELSITKDDSKADIKRSVEVLLPERVEAVTLKKIANYVKELSNQKYERTFIGYHIEGEEPGIYWATTHYDPRLEVKIIGSTVEEHLLLSKKIEITKSAQGYWLLNNGFESQLVLYKEGNKSYLRSFYADGSSLDSEVFMFTKDGLQMFKEIDNQHGEYFAIGISGDLELWGSNGRFAIASKL